MGEASHVFAGADRTDSSGAGAGPARGLFWFMRELHCPNCGAPFVRVTYQEGRVERLLSRVNVFPFRCQLCTNRFRAFYSGARHNTQAFDRRQYMRLTASIEAQVLDHNQPAVTKRITDISMDGCTLQTTGFPKGPVIDWGPLPGDPTGTLPPSSSGHPRALSRSRL